MFRSLGRGTVTAVEGVHDGGELTLLGTTAYVVHALTCVGGAVGEWQYYHFGTGHERTASRGGS